MKTPVSPTATAARRLGCVLLLLLSLAACGGSSNDDDDEAPPDTVPTDIELLDALPEDDTTLADPGIADATLSHFGYSDFALSLSGDCADGVTIERNLVDVSVDFDALFEHNQVCNALAPTAAFATEVEATRASGESFAVRLDFSTTTEMAPALQVQDTLSTPRDSVAGLFRTFVDEALVDSLDLPEDVAALLEETLAELVDSAYGDLLNADPLFDVTAQRVTYASRQPDGSASSELTGLVVFPDTASSEFTPRDSVVVLSHSTSVTPSDLDVSSGWFALASLLASRGYLVIAPDNWGRGGTDTRPETFLMATRTAANSLDLIRAVLADPGYDAARATGTPGLTLVGYSQGGHTALALWQALATQAPTLEVPQVYAGAGPYNLYATARGVVQHADGSCNDDVYCRYATDATTVPFLSERVLPGYTEYAAANLMLDTLVEGGVLTSEFVEGFLGNDPAFDALKGLLQQGSFTNITGGLDALSGAGTRFTLFHSPFDRLVPIANSEALVPVLEPHFEVELRTQACNDEAYEAVFNATDRVGISHGLCGFEMLNDVYAELQ
jgi:pimeloyl-ACP methyl ester carboxylesterase